MKIGAAAHRDQPGRIALIQPIVAIDAQLLDLEHLVELYVDQVRLIGIRLPVRVQVVVSQVLYAVFGLGTRQAPNGMLPNLRQSIDAVHVKIIFDGGCTAATTTTTTTTTSIARQRKTTGVVVVTRMEKWMMILLTLLLLLVV